MKTKDFKNMRSKTIKELLTLAAQKKLENQTKKAEVATGREKNLKQARNIRVEIAKILTLVREKQIVERIDSQKGDDSRQ